MLQGALPLQHWQHMPDSKHPPAAVPEAQLGQLRRRLDAETLARGAERALSAATLRRAQSLTAQVHRLRQRLNAAELDAEENYARCLDLEAKLAVARNAAEHDAEEYKARCLDLEAQLAIAQMKRDDLTLTLAGVLGSRSWSLTRPVRILIGILRREPWREPTLPPPP